MLGAIVLAGVLSEVLSVLLDARLAGNSLPKSIPAVLVALISASPEILTALRAAQNNRMQTTVNIALGASLAIALFSGERIEIALTPVQAGMLLTLPRRNEQPAQRRDQHDRGHQLLCAVCRLHRAGDDGIGLREDCSCYS